MNRSRSADLTLTLIALLKCASPTPIKARFPTVASGIVADITTVPASAPSEPPPVARAKLKPTSLPSTRAERLFRYGQLGVGLALGTAAQAVRRATSFDSENSSLVTSESNINRIVNTLSRMRGAALKLGQMLSINEIEGVPPEIQNMLLRLQNNADYMPTKQLEKVMMSQLGAEWRSKYLDFDEVPIAAASIGQVHRASLLDGTRVAVKVQYPLVANSIVSDLDNLSLLLKMGNFLPRGLFLENTIRVAKEELAREVDYRIEADSYERVRNLLQRDSFFKVPRVFRDVSTQNVLTSEFVDGVPLGTLKDDPQHVRDMVGENILRLCLMELFQFRFMQTDPNWSNFLYDRTTRKLNLIDFGATREFDRNFISSYGNLLISASRRNIPDALKWSETLGFLTGHETELMKKAHLDSLFTLAKPFGQVGYYDFGKQTITQDVRNQIPIMLRHRLTPPPNESYSLHRKLSGAFLLCSKLGSRVRCHDLFKEFLSER